MEELDVKKIRPGVLLFIRDGGHHNGVPWPHRPMLVIRMVKGPSLFVCCEVLELDTKRLNIVHFRTQRDQYSHQRMSIPE